MAITPDTSGYFKIIIRKFYCKLWITGLQITGFFPGLLDYSLITKITKEALRDYKPVADPSHKASGLPGAFTSSFCLQGVEFHSHM